MEEALELFIDWMDIACCRAVTAQSIVERGRDNRWCETRSIGSLKYKNLKLREKGRKEKWCRSEGCF